MSFKIRPFYALAVTFFIFLNICSTASADTSPSSSSSASVSAIFASQGSQSIIMQEGFRRIDAYMSLPQKERMLLRHNNKYAFIGAGQQVFSPTFFPDEKAGIWVKPYGLFESVQLDNGPTVSNVESGALLGVDTPLKQFKHGYSGFMTFYVSASGSHQNFDNVSDHQVSGSAAVTGALYKGNFFTGLTVNAGLTYDKTNEGLNTANSHSFAASIGSKTGYNIELAGGKLIIQPSILGIYTFDRTSPYTNATGHSVTVDDLHVIQIIPGIELIGNLKGGWQPYLRVNEVWELMDSPRVLIDQDLQPRESVGPYFEYGVGVQRRWHDDRYTSYGQIMFRGGERNGMSIYGGFRLALGREKTTDYLDKNPEKKWKFSPETR